MALKKCCFFFPILESSKTHLLELSNVVIYETSQVAHEIQMKRLKFGSKFNKL